VKIVWGRQDRILPVAFLDEYRRLLPEAEIHVVEGAGHLPHAEKPEEFVELVCR
jgi:pimeloyl-ACP methyl ester carboxylesterase